MRQEKLSVSVLLRCLLLEIECSDVVVMMLLMMCPLIAWHKSWLGKPLFRSHLLNILILPMHLVWELLVSKIVRDVVLYRLIHLLLIGGILTGEWFVRVNIWVEVDQTSGGLIQNNSELLLRHVLSI